MQIAFGIGALIATRTDISNPTPRQFGVVQDCSVDFKGDIKELMGQYQMPVGVARGAVKVTGKAKAARIDAAAFNDVFFGVPSANIATGQQNVKVAEGPTAIPGTPFQVTVTGSATFLADRGVYNNATGLPFTRVASSPSAGQYSVSAGVYTFASADTGISVLISYEYTIAAGAWPAAKGTIITIANQLMGVQPIFSLELQNQFNNQTNTLKLNQCIATSLSMAMKNGDWTIPEFELAGFTDASNVIGVLSSAEP